MATLTTGEHEQIEASIAAAETRTSAEIAVVVAQSSDSYAAFSTLWAATLALAVGGGLLVTIPGTSAPVVFAVVATLFVVLGLVLHLRAIRHRLAPGTIKRAHASRLALVQFATHVQGRTHGKVGVLLFVSLAERHVEILVERGISDVIPATAWQTIVDRFVADVRAGHLAAGLTTAVGSAAALLEVHFPTGPDNRNEIVDRVTEV